MARTTIMWLEVNGISEAVSHEVSAASNDQIVLALIAVIATSIAALVFIIKNGIIGRNIERNTNDINKAVNNVGPGEHRLYDIVKRVEEKQEELDKKWGNLPEDMDDAVTLSETIHNMRTEIKAIDIKLTDHIERAEGLYQAELETRTNVKRIDQKLTDHIVKVKLNEDVVEAKDD